MLIVHTTDFSGDDSAAFVHAAALASASGARLVTLHGNPAGITADRLPDAAALARSWGRTVNHERRCHECCDDVVDTVLDALKELKPDLVVLGTHARHGLAAILRGSLGETIARNLAVPALVVPNHVAGFVDRATGAVDLSRILVPAGGPAEEQHGVEAARRLIALAGAGDAELELFRASGKIEDAIVEAGRARRACVIVMPTRGHDGIGDVFLGSHTERVIRDASCPVLSVPITGD